MKINWQKLRNSIPNKIRTKARTAFDVLWQNDLRSNAGQRWFGVTNFEPNQIIISSDQSDKEAVYTFFHEFLHAIDDSYEVGLTEKQVRKLEKALPYFKELFEKLEGKE